VYNVPSRTGINILPETELELSKLNNMCGIKEANDNINHILELFNKVNAPIYCGNDNLNYLFNCLGGVGTISVASNAYPKLIKKQFEANSNLLQQHLLLHNFFELLFAEPNPIPIKFVLSYKGLIKNNLRLPLTPLSKKYINELVQEIEKLENL
jgi:4-hydroxy-tetrahydrodipicolinate synthase